MAKYTFTCQHFSLYNKPTDKITYEVEADTLSSVLEGLDNFLKGSGFVYTGTLDVVPYETGFQEENESLIFSSHNEDRI